MKITAIHAAKIDLELKKPFKVAIGYITKVDTVVVRIDTDEGISGFGEGSGIPFVTGETSQSVLQTLKLFEKDLIGQNPFAIDHLHKLMDRTIVRNPAAKAAVDIALHDLCAKALGVPLYTFLGGVKRTVETDLTIGIDTPENMAEEAQEIISRGFTQLKVKTGIDLADDIRSLRLIREAVGDQVKIKVDANQGYTVTECLEFMEQVHDCDIELIEQPTPYWDVEGLVQIRKKASIPIMADESLMQVEDAVHLLRTGAVDMFNIKLMKCGGLHRGMQINSMAEAANVPTMLGCMTESPLSIAAAAHLVSACPNVQFVDLDSFLSFKDVGGVRHSFTIKGGMIDLGDAPGHGVEVDI